MWEVTVVRKYDNIHQAWRAAGELAKANGTVIEICEASKVIRVPSNKPASDRGPLPAPA